VVVPVKPYRGSLWFVKLQSDPPGKNERPVVIVSPDGRNTHPRADTVIVIPLSTSVHKDEAATHMVLEPGETGLSERMIARAEDVSTVRKDSLIEPRERTRVLGGAKIKELHRMITVALAYRP
jgi:mRNA-degrading endonuclease toxin of MazEF toxin-antitoxin module